MTDERVDTIRGEADGVLRAEDNRLVSAALAEGGIDPVSVTQKLAQGALSPHGLVDVLKPATSGLAGVVPEGTVERVLLATSIRTYAPQVLDLAIAEEARRGLLSYYSRLLRPEPRIAAKMRIGHSWFLSACKLATGSRFPAGVYEFELSGVPRSWFLRMARSSPWDMVRLAAFVLTRTRGLEPFFANHMAILRDPSEHLTEERVAEAYLTIADSLELQPRVKGLLAAGWMRDPRIGVVSPHLAALSDPIVDSGGILVGLWKVDPESSGALAKSRRRREAYARGLWHPAQGVALWPREAMLMWARSYRSSRA